MIMVKRDQGCIWARHCDPELKYMIYNMVQGQPLHLQINGSPTVWVKMRDGANGPTKGIRIVEGRQVWRNIAIGEEFDLSLIQSTDFQSIDADWLSPSSAEAENETSKPAADTDNTFLHNRTTFLMVKRDQGCIWAAHCPPELGAAILERIQGQPLHLQINGSPTVWVKMHDGVDGRPTYGINIVEGRPVWQNIARGEEFEVILVESTVSESESSTSVPAGRQAESVEVSAPIVGAGSALFHSYVFADYSGAADLQAQRNAIKLAYAEGAAQIKLIEESLTRDTLATRVISFLRTATAEGKRICFGFDHQFGVPFGLLKEIGLEELEWREILDALVDGRSLPSLQHPSTYARTFNAWCLGRGNPRYFYSATKGTQYGIPASDPRSVEVETVIRLTERCPSIFGRGNPKKFNRVGDPGTVGGQTIMGLIKLRELLRKCQNEGIPVKCWPFDGLDINSAAYANSHVLLEPYPAAVRSPAVAYTDANDAIACVQLMQSYDQNGTLCELLDLGCLSDEHKDIVRREGWIVGHSPQALYGHRR